MSQFIKFTSRGADLTLLCGDLNLEPVDLGYDIIRNNAKMGDAWLDKVCIEMHVCGRTELCLATSSRGQEAL